MPKITQFGGAVCLRRTFPVKGYGEEITKPCGFVWENGRSCTDEAEPLLLHEAAEGP
jgi:hypothetical protein